MTGSGSLMEASQFSFTILFVTSQDVTFWVNVNNVPKIFSLENRQTHFLPKKCCVFNPQIETLRLSVCTLKTLSRTKVGTEYCFLELCIWEEIFDCEMHSHLEVLIWPSGTEENEILLCLKCTAPSCAVNTSNILFFFWEPKCDEWKSWRAIWSHVKKVLNDCKQWSKLGSLRALSFD